MGLFTKKEKAPDLSVVFYLVNGEKKVFNIYELPIKEEVIIEHSIKFFNDPDPCYIHKGAVTTRLLAEIEVELLTLPKNLRIHYNELPNKLLKWLDTQYNSIEIPQ